MKEHILSLSYGKDSIAAIGAIQELGWPLEHIIHVEIYATQTIPADLPPMMSFKAKADEIIKAMTGLTVERVRPEKTYEEQFYTKYSKPDGVRYGQIYGWPMVCHGHNFGAWCNSRLKVSALKKAQKGRIVYIGIAADEPARFHNLSDTKKSPLVAAGWTESDCLRWCKEHDLLSPIYETEMRSGCWFCQNQRVDALRRLRKTYPEYWALMLKWDVDSKRHFRPDGHSVHDYERRFSMEEAGQLNPDDRSFRWKRISETG
ncbi:MAG: hypothetical protein IKO14_02845 [Oscillibacter sp.]|nr:hypothetical protein [Oscillibacter sp.]